MKGFVVIISIGNIILSTAVKKRLGKKAELAPALGAVTTVLVNASSADDAFEAAKASAEQALVLSELAPILNSYLHPLVFELEDIKEASDELIPKSGFTFFLETAKH